LKPLKVPGVDFEGVQKDFTENGRNNGLLFLKILDNHRGPDKTSIRDMVERAESQKLRNIASLPPKEASDRPTEQIPWHFDQFVSILYKDRYLIRDQGGCLKEVPRPDDCGLFIKRADGAEIEVVL
jgi:hypothetical protein